MVLAALPSCGGEASGDAGAVELVVYCGRSRALVGDLLEDFEAKGEATLSIAYDATPALANQLALAGSATVCDVFFAQDAGHLSALAAVGVLQPLPDDVLEAVPEDFRGPGGRWVGTSARVRCLVYDPKRIAPADMPQRLADLADARWQGRIGWAPGNGSFQVHVTHLRHAWGEEPTRAWLEAMRANQPRRYPKNAPMIGAVARGEIDIGWLNHYYLPKARTQDPSLELANWTFPEDGDAGNLLMVSGIGIVTTDPRRREAALALVRHLLADEAQRYFARETFEYPVKPDAPQPEGLDGLDPAHLAHVDHEELIDVLPTKTMLDELGLH